MKTTPPGGRSCVPSGGAVYRLRIFAVSALFVVPMYNYHPCRFAKSNSPKENRSNRVRVISDGSPSRILRVLRISLGMTILPRSSTRRTMPVAFILSSPFEARKRDLFTVAVFAGKGELCMVGEGKEDKDIMRTVIDISLQL